MPIHLYYRTYPAFYCVDKWLVTFALKNNSTDPIGYF
jgi:hypothetical protein